MTHEDNNEDIFLKEDLIALKKNDTTHISKKINNTINNKKLF